MTKSVGMSFVIEHKHIDGSIPGILGDRGPWTISGPHILYITCRVTWDNNTAGSWLPFSIFLGLRLGLIEIDELMITANK